MTYKIALLGISHESNTFIKKQTTLDDFNAFSWLRGNAIIGQFYNAHHEIGGMIEYMEDEGVELVPVIYAAAQPGGMIEDTACKIMLDEMLQGLKAVHPVDGCLVVVHGAAVSETFDDWDGHWLSVIRKELGDSVLIIGTLDPHANASRLMINSTDALIAYKTNPHIDQRDTGVEAAKLLLNCLRKNIRPVQSLVRLPMVISIDRQHTESSPCRELFEYTRSLSSEENILSISVLFGFPYADVEDMGTSFIIVSETCTDHIDSIARRLQDFILHGKERFNAEREDPADLIAGIKKYRKPALLLDMGDNVGAGAPGNSIFILELLRKNKLGKYFICLHNPDAVSECSYNLSALHVSKGYTIKGRVRLLTEGKFTETQARHDGLTEFNMGKIAILETEDGGLIMFTSLRTPPYSLRQLTAFGINPGVLDFIVAKGVNAPIAAYQDICPAILPVDSPGVTQADITRFKFSKRRKPMFPFEQINIESLYNEDSHRSN